MAVPIITALKMWAGTLFTKDDWDFNFSQIVSWLADGTGDLVVNTVKTTNGLDLDGAQISNLGAATTGSQAITLDQANTILNRTSYYYPFSVASGKVDSNGDAAYLQKDSDTQVTVLAGNVNPDLVCICTDGTIESVTSNTVLTVPVNDGTYHIIKEKEQSITITAGASGKVTVGQAFPTSPNIGDYFCDNSVVPFKGYKYGLSGWEETQFCYLGYVTVSSSVATVTSFAYNDNNFDVNRKSLYIITPYWGTGETKAFSTVYTASKAGYVVMQSAGMQTSQYLYCSLYVNDVVRQSAMIGAGSAGQFSFCVPVSAGDTYKGLTDGTGGSLVFYPLKGVA